MARYGKCLKILILKKIPQRAMSLFSVYSILLICRSDATPVTTVMGFSDYHHRVVYLGSNLSNQFTNVFERNNFDALIKQITTIKPDELLRSNVAFNNNIHSKI